MRFLKIPILSLLLILLSGAMVSGQIIDCDAIGEAPDDIIRVVSTFAKPGDTIDIPLMMTNTNAIATFALYLEFDTTFLTPITIGVDSLYDSLGNFLGQTQSLYSYTVHNRLLYTETKFDNDGFPYLDTTTNLQIVDEIDFPTTAPYKRVKVFGAFEDLFNPEDIIEIGSDTIMYIQFVIDPAATQNETAVIDFYIEDIQTRDTEFPFDLLRNDCLYSHYGDLSGTIDVRLTTTPGVIKVDTAATPTLLPTINNFSASPSSINSGGSSTLSWDVIDATSININNGVGTFTNGTGTATVSPTVTTTYTLTASNSDGSVSAVTTVTVDGGGGGTNNNIPVVNPIAGSPFTVNQGETVAFTVVATDADATDILTLSASSIPSNATFSTEVGSGTVSSNFSFTPDFTTTPGTYVASFVATDNQGGTSTVRTASITVVEIQNDRLFTTSKLGQSPVGGLRGKQAVYFPINLVTSQTVYGVQFDMIYDQFLFSVDSFVVTGRTVDYVVYDDIGSTPGLIKVVMFGLNNEPIVNILDTTAILYAVMTIDSNAVPGDYPVTFDDGWESVNPDPDVPSLELVLDGGVIQVDTPGDVNLDKKINVADLVNIVASIINSFTLSDRQFDVADVITDDIVDVFDLVGVVNMIFGLPVSPVPIFENQTATIMLAYNDMEAGGNDLMKVSSEIPVDIAAADIEIDYNPESVVMGTPQLTADAGENMVLQYTDNKSGKLRILIHYTNPFNTNAVIQRGAVDMVEIPLIARSELTVSNNEIIITKADYSTSDAAKVEVDGVDVPVGPGLPDRFTLGQNYPNPFNPTTNINFALVNSANVKLEIYNIIGQHVKTLVDGYIDAGVHTVEWDATNEYGQNVASGIYLYRIVTGQQTQSKKMLFLK